MKMQTYIGELDIRDEYDREVVLEVIERDEYRRWGDIAIGENDLVLDLGAHIGSFSRLAGHLGAKVIAVEPCPANLKLLKANTKGLDVTAFACAVSAKPEAFLLVDRQRNELHKLVDRPGRNTIEVVGLALDDLVSDFGNPQVDLLKMDIEGMEYEALYQSRLLDRVRQITMEWHLGATKMSELIIHLEKQGFKTVWLGGNGDFGKLQMKRREL